MKRRKERFRVFTRTWWTKDTEGNLIPEIGRATTIGYAPTAQAARQMCAEWNAKHDPGELSRKAEFTEDIDGEGSGH